MILALAWQMPKRVYHCPGLGLEGKICRKFRSAEVQLVVLCNLQKMNDHQNLSKYNQLNQFLFSDYIAWVRVVSRLHFLHCQQKDNLSCSLRTTPSWICWRSISASPLLPEIDIKSNLCMNFLEIFFADPFIANITERRDLVFESQIPPLRSVMFVG